MARQAWFWLEKGGKQSVSNTPERPISSDLAIAERRLWLVVGIESNWSNNKTA